MRRLYTDEERIERHRIASLKWMQQYRLNNREKANEKVRNYYYKNKEKINFYQRKRRKDLGLDKKYKLKNRYGLSLEDYNKLVTKQNGRCAICLNCIFRENLAVDHNHLTNQIRGLLCKPCNLGLGNFKDNIFNLENAIIYLRRNTNVAISN